MSKVDLVGVGLNATDTLIPLPEYPARGSKVAFHDAHVLPGGQVATAVAACAHWGLLTRYVGKVGDDHAGRLHAEEFARLGVEAHLLTASRCKSQQAFIIVDDTGERTVLWKRDERLTLRPAELKREWITLDYFVASRDIPGRISGHADLRKALPEVHKQYGFRLTAATLGEEGVLAWDGDKFHYAAAYWVKVVDTIGAGDTFHAGFIYGLLQGWPLQRQLEFGCAAAALNCTGMGARGGIRTVGEIESLKAAGQKHRSAAVGNEGVLIRPLREGRGKRIKAIEEDLGGEG